MTPLAELSSVLGVRVAGVRRLTLHIDGRHQADPNSWVLALPDARYGVDPTSPGGMWSWPVKTRTLRSRVELTRLATVWGRDPAAEPFTNTDPRRVLRLLHETIEERS
ncbi:MAG: hypothetical protein M3R02_24880 [Chloroflexota bacterium]|nr:hypothetical protein [Chloroflexota bacterium]